MKFFLDFIILLIIIILVQSFFKVFNLEYYVIELENVIGFRCVVGILSGFLLFLFTEFNKD